MRNHSHFGGPPADYQSWPYATDADTALAQLDDAYERWITGVRALSDEDLARPCGPAEGPYADYALSELILHINREVIHHGAEIACLRDLYVHRIRALATRRKRTTMPTLAPPVRDERHALREFLAYQQSAFVAVAYGLTDEQARATPTVSALSIGGLIKHVTGMQRSLDAAGRRRTRTNRPPMTARSRNGAKEYEDEYVMRPDETLAQLLDALTAQNAEIAAAGRDRRPRRRGAGAARRAVVSQGCRRVVGALGVRARDQRAGPARRARRHHPRNHRRRNDVRARRGRGGLGAAAVADAVATQNVR